MKNRKIIFAVLLLSATAAQAGWWSNTKKWVKKTAQKVEDAAVSAGKAIVKGAKYVGNEIKDAFVEVAKEELEKKTAEMQADLDARKALREQRNLKKKEVVESNDTENDSVESSQGLDPEMEAKLIRATKNIKVLEALRALHGKAQELLSVSPGLDGMIGVKLGQMLDGFKQTNGVPSGEEEIALQVVQNIEQTFNDYENNIVSGEEVSDFIAQTFDWWKDAYWTEEMFGQGDSDYFTDDDDYWDEDWFDDEDDDQVTGVESATFTHASEEKQEAAVAAVRGGLLEQIRAGKKLNPVKKEEVKPASGKDALLEQIRAGKTLKPTNKTRAVSGVSSSVPSGGNDVMDALKVKMQSIRSATGDESDSEDDDDDWDDE